MVAKSATNQVRIMKKKAVTRSHTLRFRTYAIEKKAIEQAASVSGMAMSEYLRQCALGKEIRFRLSDEEIAILQMLREYRNNFSRLGSLIKSNQKSADFFLEIKRIIAGIDQQLKKLK